jgi:hypothetical protein
MADAADEVVSALRAADSPLTMNQIAVATGLPLERVGDALIGLLRSHRITPDLAAPGHPRFVAGDRPHLAG